MAYILKANKTLTDPFGNTSGSFYGIIDDLSINKAKKFVRFTLEIYSNRSARAAFASPVVQYTIVCRNDPVTGADFDTYFATSVLANNALWSQVQAFLVQKALAAQTKLTAADWQVDAQAEP